MPRVRFAARRPVSPHVEAPSIRAAPFHDPHPGWGHEPLSPTAIVPRMPRASRVSVPRQFLLLVAVIVAHLDLDAFFAAVEQLEDPSPAPQAARGRRRPEGPRRGRDRELRRAQARHPLGDELRRGAAPLPGRRLRAAAPRPLPRVLAGGLEHGARGRARRSSRPGSTRATSTSARSPATSSPPASSPRRCSRPSAARPR